MSGLTHTLHKPGLGYTVVCLYMYMYMYMYLYVFYNSVLSSSPPADDRHDVCIPNPTARVVQYNDSKRLDKNVEVPVEVLGDDDNLFPL